jgi:3-oxoacyl-[acyl-carrier protein] reductase
MMENGGGRLIHISSVNGLTGIGLTAYSAAKSGLFAFSRTIATQYGRHGIRSNVIWPGTVETERQREEMAEGDTQLLREEWLDQYPLGRFGRPDDVANAALYLGSKLSEFVTGSELVVDGGLTCGLDHRFEQIVYDVEERPPRR